MELDLLKAILTILKVCELQKVVRIVHCANSVAKCLVSGKNCAGPISPMDGSNFRHT